MVSTGMFLTQNGRGCTRFFYLLKSRKVKKNLKIHSHNTAKILNQEQTLFKNPKNFLGRANTT